jgi:hypothetical protein
MLILQHASLSLLRHSSESIAQGMIGINGLLHKGLPNLEEGKAVVAGHNG